MRSFLAAAKLKFRMYYLGKLGLYCLKPNGICRHRLQNLMLLGTSEPWDCDYHASFYFLLYFKLKLSKKNELIEGNNFSCDFNFRKWNWQNLRNSEAEDIRLITVYPSINLSVCEMCWELKESHLKLWFLTF